MIEKLEDFRRQLEELDAKLADPNVMKDMGAYKNLMLERSHIVPIVEELTNLKALTDNLADNEALAKEDDEDIAAMAKEEIPVLKEQIEQSEKKCKMLLIPPDPLEGKNIIMEIRAGTGGEEAALFASDLYRMYSYYAEAMHWKIQEIDSNATELGGYKEIILSISGKDVYGSLRWESGVHRVQRVPETESGGRIHTSAVTVAVLPEAEETEVDIRQEDLRIDVMRAGGPGGQCVNTTESAVRITHIPTGLVVICQNQKSQLQNKAEAMRVLRSRLYEMESEKKAKERAEERKSQVGSGDRSERIRTYNFPQNRLTDHRINLTLYKLDLIMEGQLQDVIEALKVAAGEEALKEAK
ncbi:MAG TPA: peptide chain release factor 1 [Sphaerochaeta sp.]|jgi:peptide chain release factor 1|nr:peptide chain release factor 1 [Sphaerochaeta sp.]